MEKIDQRNLFIVALENHKKKLANIKNLKLEKDQKEKSESENLEKITDFFIKTTNGILIRSFIRFRK